MTKYIGPKTDGENVATQADKLSLSSDTPDALTPDQSGAAGTAVTAARADHQHEITAGIAGTILPDATAAEGSSTSFARADHTHAIAAASAGTITGTNAEGTSTSFARADHDHAFGDKSVPPRGLPARCGCVAKHSTNQSIPNSAWTALSFDGEDLDTDAFHTTSGASNKYIKVPSGLAGVYSVFVNLEWESSSTTSSPYLTIQVNASAVAGTKGPDGGAIRQNASWVGYLAEGDEVGAVVLHFSGNSRDVRSMAGDANNPKSPIMAAFRLGGIA